MSEIRKYKSTDLEAVFEIYKLARQPASFIEHTVDTLEEFLVLIEAEEIYLAAADSEIVAFISVYSEQSFIHHLYVLPSYQKMGVGSALLNHVRNIYDLPLSLKCEKKNKAAVSFYLNSGWKKFKNGSEIDGTEYILMTLDLD